MTPTCQCHMGTAHGQVFLISSIVWSHRFRPSPSWLVVTAVGRNCYSPVSLQLWEQVIGLASHWLRVLVNITSFNVQYVVVIKLQNVYLSIVHWYSMLIRQFGYACEIRIIRLSKRKWIFVDWTAILLLISPCWWHMVTEIIGRY